MYKVIFSSLMLFSAASYADNTPVFNPADGTLTMPFISTDQGSFTAILQLNPGSSSVFKINQVGNAIVANDTTTPPTFNFTSGLLSLPKVNAGANIYTATLQFTQNLFSLATLSSIGGTPTPVGNGSSLGGCSLFPANNAWNTPINGLPLHPRSAAWVSSIASASIRTDFGNDFGQPFNLVAGSQVPKYTFNFEFPAESDVGPYPIPTNFLRENTSDNRLFIVDSETCNLYEAYNAQESNGQWSARRGAIWNLNSNALRPLGFGSADEAGLPTLPGLVRYDEVASGVINHALRFTFPTPSSGIWPARHIFGNFVPVNNTLPMGARLRLKQSYNISNFAPELQVILQAMKTYGIILADTGSSIFLSGTPDSRWSDDLLSKLRTVKGSDFEAVNSECMMVNQDSGEANPGQCR